VIRVVLKRVGTAIPLFLGVTFLVFALVQLAPVDAAKQLAGDQGTPEQIARLREQMGLDQPLWTRYFTWLGHAVHGDLGQASTLGFQPVTEVLRQRLGVTASLVILAILMSSILGALLGVIAALRPRGLVDRFVLGLSMLGISLPQFWIGLVLAYVFAVKLGWLPAVGYVPITEGVAAWFGHLLLPVMALSMQPAAEIARQLRGSLIDVMSTDYILAARARGTPQTVLVIKHALKNAAAPVVTIAGFRFSQLAGTAVVVESAFALNGLGSVATRAAVTGDVPMVLGVVVLTLLFVLLINLVVDLSYGYFNPKVRT
jgi:peptide/nickel transport system permease protein